MFSLLIDSWKDFKSTYNKYLIFEFIYLIITSFIFVPMIAFLFNRVLMAMGSSALLNMDIFKIVLNYRGLAGLIFLSALSVVIIFIEFGVLIIISQKRYVNEDILILEAVLTTIKNIPRLFGLGILQLTLLLLFIIPLLDLPLISSMVSIHIPSYMMNRIFDSNLFITLYFTLFLAGIYLFLRWIFSFHSIIIEGKSTKEAINCSIELTKHNVIKVLIKLLLLNVIIFGLGLLIISVITIVPTLIGINVENYYIENLLITFSSFLTYIFTLLLLPINVIFITRLYYQVNLNLGTEPDNNLIIYKSSVLKKVEGKAFNFFQKRKYLLLLVLIMFLTGSYFLNFSISDETINIGRNVLIAAHRGDSRNAPENSISSIRFAINKEADFIEVDVRKTKDGVIVLNHDVNLRRVAGLPYNISDLTIAEISEIDIGRLFSKKFTGEKIPTLNDVLEEVKGEARLIVEIKPHAPGREIAAEIVKLIEEHEMLDDVYIQSFDYKILEEVRKTNSRIKIGQLMYMAAGNLSSLDVDFYSIEQNMLSKQLISKARKDEREVWVWVVNKEDDIKEALRYDIDGIITNYPERVQDIIGY